MIDVMTGRLVRGDIDQRIKKWEVWFRTPFGLSCHLHEAVAVCEKAEINPQLAIIPVSVAITDSTHEVWERV